MIPSISAIIPVYNGEKYIDRIIESLEKQSFSNFEVIFINDGSQDHSLLRLEKYTKKFPQRYRVYSQSNQGVSAARNLGIEKALGEYLCFIDVDDELHELYFELLFDQLSGSNKDIAFCMSSNMHQEIERNSIFSEKYTSEQILKKFLYGEVKTGIWGMIIPMDLIVKNQLSFKEGYKYSEDLHMVWRLFNFAENIYFLKTPLYIYRENQGSAMTRINIDRFDSLLLMDDLEKFFNKKNPEFSLLFNKYGKSRMSWSLLWQAAHYLSKDDFIIFSDRYDFKKDLKKLFDFPDYKVKILAKSYVFSKYIYYFIIKVVKRYYRK